MLALRKLERTIDGYLKQQKPTLFSIDEIERVVARYIAKGKAKDSFEGYASKLFLKEDTTVLIPMRIGTLKKKIRREISPPIEVRQKSQAGFRVPTQQIDYRID